MSASRAIATVDAVTPEEVEALRAILADPAERLRSLYWIITKGDGDSDLSVRFMPNEVQEQLVTDLWHRNLVLKARQRGITTLMAILWLDTALFATSPIFCGVIAHEREAAEEIFRTKVVYAYEHLPPILQKQFPLAKKTATSLVFGHNGATIRVATSMRSSTIHRLHISELGKIAAKYPAKAKEVLTGSVPAVPSTGILVVESTAEGQQGAFYEMSQIAKATDETGRELSAKDYRFHFYSWWDADEYELDPALVTITAQQHEYFRKVEGIIGRSIPLPKRAWYVATLESDFAGEEPLMWQEYPSYPDEAFAVSIEGCYYASQLATARKQGRVTDTLPDQSAPVNTFWDIGKGDMTCIWFHQRIGVENWFISYYEASGEDLDHYARHLQDTKYVFGTHYLPHEAAHKRIGKDPDHNQSVLEMLEELLPGQRFEVVPRVTQLMAGIQATRRQFSSCRFSEQGCGQGLKRLGGYRKAWDKTRACWSDNHVHNDDSHGCLDGDTEVLTKRGSVPVRDVVVGDEVWTPAGFAAVTNSGPTKIADELIEITMSDGTKIITTPEHRFFTTRGVVFADALRNNDEVFNRRSAPCLPFQNTRLAGYRDAVIESFKGSSIGFGHRLESMPTNLAERPSFFIWRFTGRFTGSFLSAQNPARWMETLRTLLQKIGLYQCAKWSANIPYKSSMASASIGSQRGTSSQTVCGTAESPCTGMCGSSTTGKSPVGSMSTTKTQTRETTTLRTLSFLLLPSIHCFMRRGTNGLEARKTPISCAALERNQKRGTQAKRGLIGTQNTGLERGKTGSGCRSSASSVGESFSAHSQAGPNTATTIVNLERLVGQRARRLVYDLSVEKHHCYLANGLLVSNSDAFRQFGQVADGGETFAGVVARPEKRGGRRPSNWRL